MKRLVLLLSLYSINIISQTTTSSSSLIYIGSAVSYSENKELSKYIFDYFNTYRNSIGLDNFVWNDKAYESANNWNIILANHDLYGHSGDSKDRNLYHYSSSYHYEIINGTITNESYSGNSLQKQIIADSMLRSFLRSPWHEPVLCSEVKTPQQSISPTKKNVYGGAYMKLAKYAAVSVIVKNMGHYTQYILIMQLYIEMP